jgi:hypothetical protein
MTATEGDDLVDVAEKGSAEHAWSEQVAVDAIVH